MIVVIGNKKKIFTYLLFFVGCFFVFFGMISSSKQSSVPVMNENDFSLLAIIIDDFGNNSEGTDEMISLPIKFTGAVMPQMPNTEEECQKLFATNKDIILHMPMEPHKGKKSWLGKMSIMNTDSKSTALETFKKSLSQINGCIGFNNHMGSKVTENEEIMSVILNEAKNRNLIVVDSVTGPKSVIGKISEKLNLKYLKRDVFLDSTKDVSKIILNLKKATKIAKEKGFAVAIGHVGAEGGVATYQAILQTYKELENIGIKFVGVGELFENAGIADWILRELFGWKFQLFLN